MVRRVLFVVALGLLATTGVARAQYVPGISPGSPVIVPGGTATVTACCFAPGSTVTFTAAQTATAPALAGLNGLSVVADRDGLATATTTVPADLPVGVNVLLTASGVDAGGQPVTVSHTLPVVEPEAPTPPPTSGAVAGDTVLPEETGSTTAVAVAAAGVLPVTGSHSAELFVASLALTAGGLAMLAYRRRHHTDQP